MKKAGTYIVSFILSILLIFAIIGTLGLFTANKYKRGDRFLKMVKNQQAAEVIRDELEKYFTENYNNTAIPPEVYMEVIDRPGFIDTYLYAAITGGYDTLTGRNELEYSRSSVESNTEELNAAIARYFSDYADNIGYAKDKKYDEKLAKAKLNARNAITERSDVFKFAALEKRGILKKLSPIFKRLTLFLAAGLTGTAVLMLLMLLANRKEKRTALYWIGISAMIAGILGTAPCAYLLGTDYFSAFTVKQPQVWLAYTEAMTDVTTQFMTACITAAVIGIVLIIAYAVINNAVKKKEESAPESPVKSEENENHETEKAE